MGPSALLVRRKESLSAVTGKANREKSKSLASSYEPTPQERAAVASCLQRKAKVSPAPRMKVSKVSTQKGNVWHVAPNHPDPETAYILLMNSVGTTSATFLQGLLKQIANAGSEGLEPAEDNLNFMLSVIKGIDPRDQLEAMLGAQMAAVHMATMTFARRLMHVENLPQQDSAERAFNKLARTFAAQVEALKRYRTSGAPIHQRALRKLDECRVASEQSRCCVHGPSIFSGM